MFSFLQSLNFLSILHCLLLSLTLCVIDKVRRFTHKIHSPSYTFCTQGLISGSAELREQAALGLGELIEVTSEQSLKEFVIPITGYIIKKVVDVDYFSIFSHFSTQGISYFSIASSDVL